MKSFAFLIALASACLSFVAASPIEKRELGGILICQGANATGKCTHEVYAMDTCYNMTSDFYQNAATFAPDGEDFYCFPYVYPCGGICKSPTGCTFGSIDFNYENKYNLSVIGWDKYIESFRCNVRKPEDGHGLDHYR